MSAQDLQDEFLEMLKQETKMSIILILQSYGSLNLRQLSKVMGISEPSCHAHIKPLLEQEFIELDTNMADKRGKYYKPHERLEPLLKGGEQEFETTLADQEGSKLYYQNMAIALRALALMSQRFGSYAASYIEERSDQLGQTYEEKKNQDNPLSGLLSGQLTFATVASQEEIDEINSAFTQFTNKVQEVTKRNLDLKQTDAYDIIMISGLVIPLKKLDPRNQ